jgi:hypothetical protein
MPSEEIELAAKTSGAVVAALADESGSLAVPREYANYFAKKISYRHYPKLVERAMVAAEKISASGLPRRAFSALDEPLLTAILEGMAEETDEPILRESWENLLANELTEGSAGVKRAFPRILSELDAKDARLLDHFARRTSDETYIVDSFEEMPGERDGPTLDNLTRVEVLRAIRWFPTTVGQISDGGATITGYAFTELGWAFVKACREPRKAE